MFYSLLLGPILQQKGFGCLQFSILIYCLEIIQISLNLYFLTDFNVTFLFEKSTD